MRRPPPAARSGETPGPGVARTESVDERVLQVMRDIAPEWAARFEEHLKSDPEGTRRQLMQHGRRFMGLATLRDRNPDLYALKVREVRLQADAREAGIAYHEALERGDEEEVRRAEERLRDVARQAIDANLKARGEELKALADALDRFKEELLRDAVSVQERVDAMVGELIERRPSPGLFGAESIAPGTAASERPERETAQRAAETVERAAPPVRP